MFLIDFWLQLNLLITYHLIKIFSFVMFRHIRRSVRKNYKGPNYIQLANKCRSAYERIKSNVSLNILFFFQISFLFLLRLKQNHFSTFCLHRNITTFCAAMFSSDFSYNCKPFLLYNCYSNEWLGLEYRVLIKMDKFSFDLSGSRDSADSSLMRSECALV